eukprot:2070351-Alexandrium_andersonii.AAC.1
MVLAFSEGLGTQARCKMLCVVGPQDPLGGPRFTAAAVAKNGVEVSHSRGLWTLAGRVRAFRA